MTSRRSPLTNARPVIVGMTPPSTWRYRPTKIVPTIDSCRQTWPSASLPSAARQASFALVPVPQGERSYWPPGHSTKLRPSARRGIVRRAHQLDVIDHRAVVARDALIFECAANAKRESGEFVDVFRAPAVGRC